MSDVFFGKVCPALGVIIGNSMFLTPMPAVLKARAEGDIGELNPAPWVVAYISCLSWVVYSYVKDDFFLFFANTPGCGLGLFYSLSAIVLLTKRDAEGDKKLVAFLQIGIIFGVIFWAFIAMIAAMCLGSSPKETEAGNNLIGAFGCIFAMLYYTAPLTTVATIIKTKDSSSLYRPMLFVNLVNSSLWLFYGSVGVNDVMIWFPNVVGVTLTIFQITLTFLYGKPHAQLTMNEDVEAEAGDIVNPMAAPAASF